MPRFSYGGQDLDLDWLISYNRVSSPQQDALHGGGGIDRQTELFAEFQAFSKVLSDPDIGSLVDEGISGSKGKHVEDGALGKFLDVLNGKVRGKRIKPRTGLVVESFSRLCRLPIDDALHLFLQIIRGEVALITLSDRMAYTREALRQTKGQIHRVAAGLEAARVEAESKVWYSTINFKKRRGGCNNVIPSWIDKTVNGVVVASVKGLVPSEKLVIKLVVNEEKAAIIRRVFQMALTQGVDAIARELNKEGVPVLCDRKRLHRTTAMWDKGSINKLLRSESVLGRQSVGKYVNGKRVVARGEFTQAYPAVIDRQLFDLVQAKMNDRGRNNRGHFSHHAKDGRLTNMFGDVARCQCGNRMKIHRRGDRGEFVYLGCSAAYVGKCDNKNFFRLDKIECEVLPACAAMAIDDKPKADPTATLDKRIIAAKKELARIEAAYEKAAYDTGRLAERVAAKLKTEFDEKETDLRKLEAERNRLTSATPKSEAQKALRGVLSEALEGEGEVQLNARRIIADALPSLIGGVVCRKDGSLAVVNPRILTLSHFAARKRR